MIPQCSRCGRMLAMGVCEKYPEGVPPEILENAEACEFVIDRTSPEAKALHAEVARVAETVSTEDMVRALSDFETGLKAMAYDEHTPEVILIPGPKGDKGDRGDPGQTIKGDRGERGARGPAGSDGRDGRDGEDGDSAYEIWLSEGHVGSKEDFLESLRGPRGLPIIGGGGGGGGSSGEITTASNLGTASDGEGVYDSKVGTDLKFRRIKAGTGITLTSEVNDIMIAVPAPALKERRVQYDTGTVTIPINSSYTISIPLTEDYYTHGELIVQNNELAIQPLARRNVGYYKFTTAIADAQGFAHELSTNMISLCVYYDRWEAGYAYRVDSKLSSTCFGDAIGVQLTSIRINGSNLELVLRNLSPLYTTAFKLYIVADVWRSP